MSLEALVTRWLNSSLHRFTARTQDHYRMAIQRFADSMPQNIGVITVEHIERYVTGIAAEHTSRTANAHLTAIKSFYRSMSEWNGTDNVAAKVKMLREEPPKQRVLTHDEYLRVLDACLKPMHHDMIEFFGNTGLRRSEFQSLRWSNISQDLQYLTIVGKGRKQRLVPLNQTCREILNRYQPFNSTTIDFIESYKRRDALYRITKRLSKRVRIPRFGPQAIRHYFATELKNKGVPIAKISKLLGHASIRTTERIYIHWLPDDLKGVTDCLD